MHAFRFNPFIVASLVLISLHSLIPFTAAAGEQVLIPVGTQVMLAFEETVNPKTASVGDKVFFKVTHAVVVDGKVVIAEGAIATGEVSSSRKKGVVGKPAEIGVVIRIVEAVDGTMVPVSGMKTVEGESQMGESVVVTILCCILALLMKGGDAEFPAGSTLEAMVDVATTVEVSD